MLARGELVSQKDTSHSRATCQITSQDKIETQTMMGGQGQPGLLTRACMSLVLCLNFDLTSGLQI